MPKNYLRIEKIINVFSKYFICNSRFLSFLILAHICNWNNNYSENKFYLVGLNTLF